jgi:hypothetical protein
MAGRPGKFQPRFTAGELDALLQQNTDVDAYEKGASQMINARPLPQGGFTARDGTFKVQRVRGLLTPCALSGASFPFTIAVGANTVVCTLTLPAGSSITCVDVGPFAGYLSGAPAPTYSQPNPPESPLVAGTISVQYLNGATWTQIDQALGFVDTLRNRRFALPVGQTALTQSIRVIVNCTTSGGAGAFIGGVQAWEEMPTLSAAKYRPFTYTSALAYDMIFTQGNVEVYLGNARVASIPYSATADQVTATKTVQELATMVLTHQAVAPQLIQRQGADDEWEIHPAQFTGVPNYDFGDVVYTNSTPAQWELTFVTFDSQLGSAAPPLPTGGAHYTIAVNGVSSTAHQQPSTGSFATANWTGTAAAIAAAIESLPGVATGVTVSMTQNTANFSTFLVTMAGVGNEGDGWALSGVVLDKADAAITAQKYQVGINGGEAIMSSSRGWPAACCFVDQRLALGGFPKIPLGILLSESGNPYMLDTTLTAATAPMLLQLEGTGDETIIDIHLGRTLNVFTTYGEYWFQPGTLSATAPPTIVYSTSNGIAPTVEPIESEGVTVLTHASQGVLLEYYYEYQFQNYSAKPISTSASSLIQGITDNALQRATEGVDTNRHYLVRANGDAVLRATMRTEDINAFAQVLTDGEFISVGVNANAEACWIVQREINGQLVNGFEKMRPGLWLDAAEFPAIAAGAATISGLNDFIGATVWAIVDGYTQGPFTVDATATIGLAFAALANGTATVGRWTAPLVETLPTPRDVGPRTVARRPGRCHTVRLNVVDTTNVAIGANGGGVYDCPLYRFGGPADVPASARPYTGWTKLEGFPGYVEDITVVITQTRPGGLTVTGVVVEVDL